MHLARITATLANAFRDTSKRSNPYKTEDFTVFKPVTRKPTGEALFNQLLFINRLFGGQVTDHRQRDGQN